MRSVQRIAQGVKARIHRHLLDPLHDWHLGIRASGRHQPGELALTGPNAAYSNEYFGTPSMVLDRALGALGIDFGRFVFVDLGLGKGRALLRAALHPFRRVEGVELSEAMHKIALQNIQSARALRKMRAPIITHNLDAVDYELPSEPLVFYLFNSFGAPVLSSLLDRIEASLRAHPRDCYFIYLNPAHQECFEACTLLRPIPRPALAAAVDRLIAPWPFTIYQFQPQAAAAAVERAQAKPNGGMVACGA